MTIPLISADVFDISGFEVCYIPEMIALYLSPDMLSTFRCDRHYKNSKEQALAAALQHLSLSLVLCSSFGSFID